MDAPSPQRNTWDDTAGRVCAVCCLALAGLAVWTVVDFPSGKGMVISTAVGAILFVSVSVGYLLRFALTIRAAQVLAILIFAAALIARFQTGERVLQFGVLPWLLLTALLWQNARLERHIKAAKKGQLP